MAKKKWTVMVYLAGDNNLTEDMVNALNGLRQAMQKPRSNEQINVVAVYDSGYPTVGITHYHFRYLPKAVNLGSYEVPGPSSASYKPPTLRNPADMLYIKNFVAWAAKNYPADQYAMILSGHSDAILGKTMFRDENPERKLSLGFLARLLRDSARENLKKNQFDVVGFDSCLMGMLEVGCQLTDITDFLVASQGLAPTAGWAYDQVLKSLVDAKGLLSPDLFAQSIVENQIAASRDFRISGRFMSLSSVELAGGKALQLRRSLNNLARTFNNVFRLPTVSTPTVPPAVVQGNAMVIVAIKKLIHDSHLVSQTSLHEQAVDVGDFIEALRHNCNIKKHEISTIVGGPPSSASAKQLWNVINTIIKQCNAVETDVGAHVKASRASGPDYQFATGVSLFFPWTRVAFDLVYNTYVRLRFSSSGKSEWFRFVEKFTELTRRSRVAVPIIPADIATWYNQHVTFNHQTSMDESGLTRSGTLKSGTLKSGTLKSQDDLYYRLFRRHRNFPIDHDKP